MVLDHKKPALFPFMIILFHLILICHLQATNAALTNTSAISARQFLATHNAVRSAVGMPPLRWNVQVARYAEWNAGRRRGDCALRHSNGPYGENIFWGSGTGWVPGQAVRAWASERKWYRYGSNSCAGGQQCGHYTQMVWRDTANLGCAMVTCDGGRGTFITCNYDPPGNYIGERPF